MNSLPDAAEAQNRALSLAQVNSAAFLDFPLPGGMTLGQATRAEVMAGAEAYLATAKDASRKGEWLKADRGEDAQAREEDRRCDFQQRRSRKPELMNRIRPAITVWRLRATLPPPVEPGPQCARCPLLQRPGTH